MKNEFVEAHAKIIKGEHVLLSFWFTIQSYMKGQMWLDILKQIN